MIVPQAIAVQGVGFLPITLATDGFIIPSGIVPFIFSVRHFPPPGSAGGGAGGGGTGAGPMWITFDDQPAPRPAPILIQPDGTEVYDRASPDWSDRAIDRLLSGFRAMVPYRPVPLAVAEPAKRPHVAAAAAASALAALMDMLRTVTSAQTKAYQALAAAVAALARKETELTVSVERLRREQEELRAQQAALAAAAAATDVEPDTPVTLTGAELLPLEPTRTDLVASPRPPLWRILFAGALVLGAVAIAAATLFYLTRRRRSSSSRPS